MLLPGKVAVITGAGRGIGRAVALLFAREGARVVLASRTEVELRQVATDITAAGGWALAVPTDVTSEAAVQALMQTGHDRGGRIDVLVNNVGVGSAGMPIAEMDLATWDAAMGLNVRSALIATRAVFPSMIRQRSGKIVNVSSVAAKRPILGGGDYSTSKAALNMLTRACALEGGPHGIHENAVCPGLIPGTRLAQEGMQRRSRVTGRSVEEMAERFRQVSPLRRFVTLEEVARTIVFFASEMSDGITGQTLNVDAGHLMG